MTGRGPSSPSRSATSCAMPSSASERIAPLARRVGLALAVYAALAWLPWAVSEYHLHVLVTSFYYVVLAIGWNLLAGYTGQFSLAHHTFAGVGAYTSALLVLHAKVPIVVGVAAGVALAALLGWGLGTLCLRMRAIYLALATWAFAESVRLFVAVEYQITRGDLGLMTPFFFGTPRPTPHYYVFLGLALAAILAAWQRSEEHTSELQSLAYLVCRLLLEKKNKPT